MFAGVDSSGAVEKYYLKGYYADIMYNSRISELFLLHYSSIIKIIIIIIIIINYHHHHHHRHRISHFSVLAGKYSPKLGCSNQQD